MVDVGGRDAKTVPEGERSLKTREMEEEASEGEG